MVLAFQAISVLDCHSFHHHNKAQLMLHPKVDNPVASSDYCPISLIHNFGKNFYKIMANRFAPHLPHMISPNQSAFIKGRQIEDNFKYTLGRARTLSIRKTPSVLFKLTLPKLLTRSTGSSSLSCSQQSATHFAGLIGFLHYSQQPAPRSFLNRVPGHRLCHGRGLKPGDPFHRCSLFWL
jgi:hypothetical protein